MKELQRLLGKKTMEGDILKEALEIATGPKKQMLWCSDGFEIGCDNKEKVRVAFALDCCDREAIAHIATTEGIKSQDVQDLVITAVENRFGRINMLPQPIEWLTDNGSCFIAKDTKSLYPGSIPGEASKQFHQQIQYVDAIAKRDNPRFHVALCCKPLRLISNGFLRHSATPRDMGRDMSRRIWCQETVDQLRVCEIRISILAADEDETAHHVFGLEMNALDRGRPVGTQRLAGSH